MFYPFNCVGESPKVVVGMLIRPEVEERSADTTGLSGREDTNSETKGLIPTKLQMPLLHGCRRMKAAAFKLANSGWFGEAGKNLRGTLFAPLMVNFPLKIHESAKSSAHLEYSPKTGGPHRITIPRWRCGLFSSSMDRKRSFRPHARRRHNCPV